jgi:TIR domain
LPLARDFLAASASITMPATRKRFFISYSRADKDLVEPIVQLLRTAPTDVFFDIDSIEPGAIWTDRLERAIKGASSFVIFWCDHSAKSSWDKAVFMVTSCLAFQP